MEYKIRDQYSKVKSLDEGFVGTGKYMGVAFFWDQRVRILMCSLLTQLVRSCDPPGDQRGGVGEILDGLTARDASIPTKRL